MEEYIDIKKYIESEKIFECTEVGEYNENYYNIDKKINDLER